MHMHLLQFMHTLATSRHALALACVLGTDPPPDFENIRYVPKLVVATRLIVSAYPSHVHMYVCY